MQELYESIDQLQKEGNLPREAFAALIRGRDPQLDEYLFEKSRKVREQYYGRDVYIRGLIEFTNYCRNDCLYCGIRRSNRKVRRYRLSEDEILACCTDGYRYGFRTFVLQGGEDPWFTDEKMCRLISRIRTQYPDCAITLSIGEKSRESYQAYFEAGADRYLLRHETYNADHYARLHPPELSAEHRQQCLRDLKEIGYQVGTGFMVGSPFQTPEHLAEDLAFLQELQPHMVGIGPFIPHHDTPFGKEPAGTLELTLFLLGLIRLLLPKVLLPATTALGSISPDGREQGILAGANVVMPNLSPPNVRKDYSLYDHKLSSGAEAAECRRQLETQMNGIGYRVVTARGDSLIGIS